MTECLLKEYLKDLMSEVLDQSRRLRVFDFDDTLVKTDGKAVINHADGTTSILSTGEYAIYDKRPGDQIDFSEFDDLDNPKMIKWTTRILRKVFKKYGPEGCVILTARHNGEPIKEFLNSAGFNGIEVVALATGEPKAKAQWIDSAIKERNLHFIEFFDDSHKNVTAVRDIQKHHKDVKIVTRHIKHPKK